MSLDCTKPIVHQIDLSLKKRESSWVLVCPDCQCERIASYSQAWNITRGKSSGKCFGCIDRKFNKRSTPWNKGLSGHKNKITKKNKIFIYLRVFNQEIFDTPAIKLKQREAKLGKCGENANAWMGGKTEERTLEMSRDLYKNLRKDVFSRDNYTCGICFVRGGKLQMDHIKEWCNYPELRYELSNCRTLCESCHKTTDNYGSKAKRRGVSCPIV